MRERTRLGDQVERVRKLERELSDAVEFAELAQAENDEASLDDAAHQLALLKDLSGRAELEALLSGTETLVAFDSPRRVATSLSVLAAVDPSRPVAICRELTKVHEEVVRGSAGELADRFEGEVLRGEVAIVIGGAPAPSGVDSKPAVAALRRLVEAGAKPRAAASAVAELTGVSANELYRALTAEGPSTQ